MFFPNPLLEAILGGSKRPCIRKSAILGAIFDFWWVQKSTLEATFSTKKLLFGFLLSYGTALGADHWFLHRFFIKFSCFFRTPFQRPFLEGPNARLYSKVRFWSDLRFFKGPEIDPWNDTFSQKGSKKWVGRSTGRVLEPTWARFGAENAPRTYFSRFGTVFGWFWKGFQWN